MPSVPTLVHTIDVIRPKPEQESVAGRVTSAGNLNYRISLDIKGTGEVKVIVYGFKKPF